MGNTFTTTTAAAAGTSTGYFDTLVEADALATTLPATLTPGLSQYLAADDATRAAALLMATVDVDRAYVYQGTRYDPSANQTLEFPRLAYGTTVNNARPVWDPIMQRYALPAGTVIWDLDLDGNVVVPANVKLATLLQACSLCRGDRGERLQAIADGLAGQAVGSLSENYRATAEPAVLVERAASIMSRYALRQGELL